MHDGKREDLAPTRHLHPRRLVRQAGAAHRPRREAERAAAAAALHHELVAARGLEERRQLGGDGRDRLRRLVRHDASLESTSVECVESTPPLPETSAMSCFATWRAPPSPRTWMTASDTGVMPHM